MKIALIHMPFGPIRWPSIGLSLLSAAAQALDVECDVRYFALDCAKKIGVESYQRIAENEPHSRLQLGEWLFSSSLNGFDSDRKQAFLAHAKNLKRDVGPSVSPWDDQLVELAATLHDQADDFVERCYREIEWEDYDLIGFSSTFQQNVASLALAQKIKSRHPESVIAFGGSNWEGPMGHELLSKFTFVDWSLSGEGDIAFPEALKRLRDGQSLAGIPGVFYRDGDQLVPDCTDKWSSPVRNMNELPQPDFKEYFEQVNLIGFSPTELDPVLIFETSRGCWWGQKHHCTFCGLNKESMFYRRKKPELAVDQLCELVDDYGIAKIQTVDDIIDMSYFKTFLPQLIERERDLELFYETKANLTRDQLATLRKAGVIYFQPGIESISDTTLDKMDKGVSAIQNIRLLKWSRELGLKPIWNILWGFPEDDSAHYEQLPEVFSLLTHLSPPDSAGPISIHRFSPLYEQQPDVYQPVESYQHIYPSQEDRAVDAHNVAYLFDPLEPNAIDPADHAAIVQSIRDWKRAYARSDLLLIQRDGQGLIIDTRPIATKNQYEPNPLELKVLQATANGATLKKLATQVEATQQQLEYTVNNLKSLGYLLQISGKWLALPTDGINIKPGAKQFLQVKRLQTV